MTEQTRKQFLKTIAAGVSGLAMPAGSGLAQTREPNTAARTPEAKADSPAAIPSYLRSYEKLYREDPRAAAVEWHRNAKWGLFVHYALHSLRGLTAREIADRFGEPPPAVRRLIEYARLRARAERAVRAEA
jgi:hypothetical protein